eukprot:8517168-Pyramimonas_sp.AAC.1
MAFSEDGALLAFGCADGTVEVYLAVPNATSAEQNTAEPTLPPASSSGETDHANRNDVWRLLALYREHPKRVGCVRWAPRDDTTAGRAEQTRVRTLASAGDDGRVCLYAMAVPLPVEMDRVDQVAGVERAGCLHAWTAHAKSASRLCWSGYQGALSRSGNPGAENPVA